MDLTHIQFRATLASLGLRQVDLARLLAHFDPSWRLDKVTVNRWALPPPNGVRVPAGIVMALELWAMLPEQKRRSLLETASERR